MAKTYEQRMRAYRNLCINHAHLELLNVLYQINSERPEAAGAAARIVARWYFKAYPEAAE